MGKKMMLYECQISLNSANIYLDLWDSFKMDFPRKKGREAFFNHTRSHSIWLGKKGEITDAQILKASDAKF